ncbi:hypothetical protein BI081_gp077 [Mycobacterium phage Tonenili]|uniref:Uncharacterized protein n=1 Tax=Mycobacterium phage Tonenili TaxID=1891703 RepID=A0A1C9EH61_9CAUD|nr:hypothetical protein BI081_gp077 [Mycobacterium phage Tonenili]AON96828.1 hypothetical protein SEA_TONENILI_77 [Mycobacterium phage Tonenili]
MAHNDLVKLASEANERALYLREQMEAWTYMAPAGIVELLAAVDALTGAVVELAATDDDVAAELEALQTKFDRLRTCR